LFYFGPQPSRAAAARPARDVDEIVDVDMRPPGVDAPGYEGSPTRAPRRLSVKRNAADIAAGTETQPEEKETKKRAGRLSPVTKAKQQLEKAQQAIVDAKRKEAEKAAEKEEKARAKEADKQRKAREKMEAATAAMAAGAGAASSSSSVAPPPSTAAAPQSLSVGPAVDEKKKKKKQVLDQPEESKKEHVPPSREPEPQAELGKDRPRRSCTVRGPGVNDVSDQGGDGVLLCVILIPYLRRLCPDPYVVAGGPRGGGRPGGHRGGRRF
jgi:hypothetical protein